MKERPIIFNSDMVKAILDGRKTQTRRVIKPCSKATLADGSQPEWVFTLANCPYGQVGDRLRVKETFMFNKGADARESFIGTNFEFALGNPPHYLYRADDTEEVIRQSKFMKWRPSIFMPKKASRIWLEITGLRAERLRNASPADAIAEGFKTVEELISAVLRLNHLPEDADPWVWVISFKRVE